MRLERVGLDAWGHYQEGARVELPAGAVDLHVVHGPNEAGKSTFLRALQALFLGLGRAPADGFAHGPNRLAVSARAVLDDGRVLEWRRSRKDRRTPVATLAGVPLDDAGLTDLFGGVDEPTWRSLYGFSGQDLAAGADRLAELRLAELLLGDADPERARQELEKRANELLLPSGRGKKDELQRVATGLVQLRADLDRLQLRPSDWEARHQALAFAEAEAAEARGAHEAAATEVDRLERLCAARPHLERARDAARALEALPDPRGTPPDGEARLDGLRRAIELARHSHADAERVLINLRAELAALEVDPALEAAAITLERLVAQRASFEKEARALSAERAELEQRRVELDALAVSLVDDARPEALDAVPLTSADQRALDELAGASARLAEERSRLGVDLAGHAAERARLDAAAGRLGEAIDAAPFQAALVAAEGLEERLGRLASADRRREEHERQRVVLRRRLEGAWPEGAAPPSDLPPPAWVDHWVEEHRRVRAQPWEDARRDLEASERARDALRADVAEHEAGLNLPSADALAGARAARDEHWAEVRAALHHGALPALQAAGLLAEQERRSAHADALADQLIAGARALAERQARHARLAAQEREVDERRARFERAAAQVADAERAWERGWTGRGLRALSPPEMRRWLEDHASCAAREEGAREAEAEAANERAELDRIDTALASALGAAALPTGGDLRRRLERVRATNAQLVADHGHRAALERDRVQHRLAGEHLAERSARLELEEAHLARRWTAARQALGIPARVEPAAGPAWAREVASTVASRRQHAARVRGAAERARALEAWEQAVIEGLSGLAPRTLPRDPLSLAGWADGALRRLTHAVQERERLQRAIPVQEQVRAERRAAVEAAEAELGALFAAVGVDDDEAWRALARAALRRAELRGEVESARAAVDSLRREEPAESFAEAALARPAPALLAELSDARSTLARAAGARDQASEARAGAAAAVRAVDGSSAAAERAAMLTGERRRLREGVRRWLVLVAARRVLERALQRFEHEQVPTVVHRMSSLFQALTEGRYAGVVREGDGPGGLRALTQDGDGLEPDRLSEGTSQQLYLAARLAWAEHHAKEREALPLVLDDVLAAFDDRRALAALRVLGDLARRRQVLLLTHHRHIVALAGEVLVGPTPIALGPNGGRPGAQPPT